MIVIGLLVIMGLLMAASITAVFQWPSRPERVILARERRARWEDSRV